MFRFPQRHPKHERQPGGETLLSDLQEGEEGHVVRVQGGHRLENRMAVLGFTPGAQLSVIQNPGFGPLIVSLRGTRIALGRQESKKVVITRETA